MTTVHASRGKPGDFTDILDRLDTVPHGHQGASHKQRDAAWTSAYHDAETHAPIAPETLAQNRDWLAQLLGNMSTLWTGAARAWISPSSSPYAEEGVGISADSEMFDSEVHTARGDRDYEVEKPSLSEQDEIAAELGLKPGLSEAELRRLRRTFALENHPDRLIPEFREEATRRMTIANMLIDEVLHKHKAPAH